MLKPSDLRAFLYDICETMEPSLTAHKVKLLAALPDQPMTIAGDTDRLQQVFTNLINNALDAMPDGGEMPLSATRQNGYISIAFSDTGCGMDAET